jgi:putative transposase
LLLNIIGAKLEKYLPIFVGYFSLVGKFSLTNLQRWSIGLSKRTLERRFGEALNWDKHQRELVNTYLSAHLSEAEIVLLGDETVGKKSGKSTHGIGYHYNSKSEQVEKSIAISCLSICCVKEKLCLPVSQKIMEFPPTRSAAQEKRNAQKRAARKAKSAKEKAAKSKKGKEQKEKMGEKGAKKPSKKAELTPPPIVRGRPKGIKNKVKPLEAMNTGGADSGEPLSYTFQVLDELLKEFRSESNENCKHFSKVKIFVGDGAYGNSKGAAVCLANGFDLVSRFNPRVALFFPFSGEQSAKGRKKIYGDKLDVNKLPESGLVQKPAEKTAEKTVEKTVELEAKLSAKEAEKEEQKKEKKADSKAIVGEKIYQFKGMLHRNFSCPLNVVVVVRLRADGSSDYAILMSTNLDLSAEKIIELFEIRFQMEFTFRDARQFFGLTNFQNTKKMQVQNVVDGSFLMTTISRLLIYELKKQDPDVEWSIQDIKAFFRAKKYLDIIFNDPIFDGTFFLSDKTIQQILNLGAIHLSAA